MDPFSNSTSSFLVTGLGNPGRDYKFNRHNIGFMLLDSLSNRLDVSFTRVESRSLVVKHKFQDRSIILAKPQTFMNLSGQAIGALVKFYKIPLENLLIVYDEVDLPLGVIRLRPSGGSAGHKGMISIINRLNSQEFPRMRMGIGRPPGRMDAGSYVLRDFSDHELEFLPEFLDRGVDAVLTFITHDLDTAMNRFNGPIDDEEI